MQRVHRGEAGHVWVASYTPVLVGPTFACRVQTCNYYAEKLNVPVKNFSWVTECVVLQVR